MFEEEMMLKMARFRGEDKSELLLDYISGNPHASIPKMAAALGMSVSTLRRTLKKMAHLVWHEGPVNGGRWVIAHNS